LRATDKALARAAEAQGLVKSDELEAIRQSAGALKEALTGDDHRKIRQSIEALNKASYPLAERLMNHSLQDALKDKKLSQI
jgi:molecular chaperone DnaK/molecular chaperone HscA